MKKKIVIKIILSFLSVLFLILSIIQLFDILPTQIKSIKNDLQYIEVYGTNSVVKSTIEFSIKQIVYSSLCVIAFAFCFLVINIKGLQFVTVSTIQLIKEHKESTKEERAEKKQAKLAREIAQKQAELEKMNENTKKE